MWYETEAAERRIAMGRMSDFGTAGLTHNDARAVFDMWQDLRGDRPAPFRAELDAGRIGARAPFLAILEYVGPSNFRVRIAGDRLNRWFGIELRGMSALSMIEPAARNHFQGALNRLVAEPAVAAVRGAARRADGFSAPFEMVLLPMRSDFGRIDRILVGLWLVDAPTLTAGPLRLDAQAFVVSGIRDDDSESFEPSGLQEPAVEPPALRPIEGGAKEGSSRRGHLRLVKGGADDL